MTQRLGNSARLKELGITLIERRRVHDIGPLDAIDVSATVAAGTAGFSIWTTRGQHWATIRLPAGAPLSQVVFIEAAEYLGPYATREEACQAALRRLLACVALLAQVAE